MIDCSGWILDQGDRVTGDTTVVAGIPLPSASPVFLTVVGFHVVVALCCVVAGLVAMLSSKGRGRHSTFGRVYYWCLAAVSVSAAGLSLGRWAEDYDLLVLGALAFIAASLGRTAVRRRWRNGVRLHIAGMSTSYILLLTAFYVDNGKNLPLWKALPPIAYWLLPGVVGIPLIIRAVLWHPLVRHRNAVH